MKIKIKKILASFAVFSIVSSLIFALPVLAATLIYPGNMGNWGFYSHDSSVDIAAFVPGEAPSGFGTGSVRLSNVSGGSFYSQLTNDALDGQRLDSITALSYWAKSTSGKFPRMRLVVDRGNGQLENLTFAPEDQTLFGGQSTTPGIWQNWDGLTGHWQTTSTNCSFDFGHPGLGQCSLSEYLRYNPNATIVSVVDAGDYGVGGIRLIVGGTFVSDGYVDGVVINSDVYDFEYNPPVVVTVPTNMDQCKKGGWQTFTNPTFKNQGSCVSFVEANENAGK